LFINFYYQLKSEGVPVSFHEWMTLMEALSKGLAYSSLTGFYYLARAILVKSETHFDRFDLAFAKSFSEVNTPQDLLEQVMDWLQNALPPVHVAPDQRTPFAEWNLQALIDQVEDRLKTQKGEHHGGKKWIGTGGSTPHGHSGYHAAGLRIGGESINQSAVKVAINRQYRSFRDDQITSVRQFEVALRKLRHMSSSMEGPRSELDIDATINATCKNAGMLKLIWDRPRRNSLKLVILMDSGGSMDTYVKICKRLFAAADRATHFKDMQFYYFHNCVYDHIYRTPHLRDPIATDDVLKSLNSEYRLLIIGDGTMAPSELTMINGAIEWGMYNEHPGIFWLQRLATHFPFSVWLNPRASQIWRTSTTTTMIQKVFPMFHLSPEGLEQAMQKLKTKN